MLNGYRLAVCTKLGRRRRLNLQQQRIVGSVERVPTVGGSPRQRRVTLDAVASLTVQALVDEPSLGLSIVAGVSAAGSVVRNAHTTDLDHPGRYIVPGELILTNGLWVNRVNASDWVAEVFDAGAAAIGFGLTPDHVTVPDYLAEVCDEAGIALLDVPEALPFSAIADHINLRTRQDQGARLRRQLIRSRTLMQRLAEGGGYSDLLEVLNRESQLPAAFIGPGGKVLASTHRDWPNPDVANRAARVAIDGELPSSVSPNVSVFGLPIHPPIATLIVAAPFHAIGDDSRYLIEQVAAYAAFEDGRQRALRESSFGLAEELVRLVRDDEIGEIAYSRRLLTLGLDPSRRVTPIATDLSLYAALYAIETLAHQCVIAREQNSRIVLVQDPEPDFSERLGEVSHSLKEDAVFGWGGSAEGPQALRRALQEADLALRVARTRHTRGSAPDGGSLGSHHVLLELLEPSAVARYRTTVLAPLESWDKSHDSDLITTLRTFLELSGRWRETAARLHIHQNTLRYRLARVEQLTGRSLAEMADRVDLYLALSTTGDGRLVQSSSSDVL